MRSSRPSSLIKQGQVGQVAQDYVKWGFEYLQELRLHSLLVTSVAVDPDAISRDSDSPDMKTHLWYCPVSPNPDPGVRAPWAKSTL